MFLKKSSASIMIVGLVILSGCVQTIRPYAKMHPDDKINSPIVIFQEKILEVRKLIQDMNEKIKVFDEKEKALSLAAKFVRVGNTLQNQDTIMMEISSIPVGPNDPSLPSELCWKAYMASGPTCLGPTAPCFSHCARLADNYCAGKGYLSGWVTGQYSGVNGVPYLGMVCIGAKPIKGSK